MAKSGYEGWYFDQEWLYNALFPVVASKSCMKLVCTSFASADAKAIAENNAEFLLRSKLILQGNGESNEIEVKADINANWCFFKECKNAAYVIKKNRQNNALQSFLLLLSPFPFRTSVRGHLHLGPTTASLLTVPGARRMEFKIPDLSK